MAVAAMRTRSPGLGPAFGNWPVRLRDELEQVAVRVVEIDAPSTIKVIDLAAPIAIEVRVEGDIRVAHARERGIELGVTDEKGAVVRAKVIGVDIIERDAVTAAHRDEARPLRSRRQSENAGENLRGRPLVLRRDDDVVQLYAAHPSSPSWSRAPLRSIPWSSPGPHHIGSATVMRIPLRSEERVLF